MNIALIHVIVAISGAAIACVMGLVFLNLIKDDNDYIASLQPDGVVRCQDDPSFTHHDQYADPYTFKDCETKIHGEWISNAQLTKEDQQWLISNHHADNSTFNP